jgi:hypothetical protein
MQPELVISYDRDMYPISGTCSACREAMPQSELGITPPKESIERLAEQFRLHLSLKHSGGQC